MAYKKDRRKAQCLLAQSAVFPVPFLLLFPALLTRLFIECCFYAI